MLRADSLVQVWRMSNSAPESTVLIDFLPSKNSEPSFTQTAWFLPQTCSGGCSEGHGFEGRLYPLKWTILKLVSLSP